MSRTYTKREIAGANQCSLGTIEKDLLHLNLEPQVGDRGVYLYSSRDFDLISQLREHCKNKANTRESFVPNTEIEIVEDEPKVTKLVKHKPNTNRYTESIQFALAQDPFADLELLQRICDNNWLIPASRLAPILNISTSALNKHDVYIYSSFTCLKEDYTRLRAIWSVKRRNLNPYEIEG